MGIKSLISTNFVSFLLALCSSNALAANPMVAVEESHSMALKTDGTVWSWGDNTTGQLGDGTIDNHPAPVQVPNLSNVIQVAAGGAFISGTTAANHSAAVKADGTLWTWGSDKFGQLGIGEIPNNACLCRNTPTQVAGLNGVMTVAMGSQHTVALKSDGTVWTWGNNAKGQLGNGNNTSHASPAQVPGLSDVIAVSAGYQHTLALKSDGTVWAWGNNSAGALGDNTRQDRNAPVQVSGLGSITRISAGAMHSVALKSDGSVWAWGLNSPSLVYGFLPTFGGQIGDGTTIDRLAPVEITSLGNNVHALAAGSYHTTFLKAGGSVWATGNNTTGQLGDGTTINRLTPVQVTGLSGSEGIAAGSYHTVALQLDGGVMAWGNNGYGELGTGEFGLISVAVTTPVKVVNTNKTGFLNLLDESGGANSIPTAVFTLAPVTVSNGYAVSVDASYSSDTGSTISEYGWRASDGQTATGKTATFSFAQAGNYSIELTVVNLAGASSGASASISLPAQSTAAHKLICDRSCFAVGAKGTLQGWGDNRMGQLGINSDSYSPIPKQPALLANVSAVAAGIFHTLAVRSDGSVLAWGGNSLGQLGNYTTGRALRPAPVAGISDAMAVAAGFEFSLALLSDGSVWSWGWNYYGQLGNGSTSGINTANATPAPVRNLNGIQAIAGGGSLAEGHGVALKADGTVWTWGSNDSGQLGDGSWVNRTEPVSIAGLSDVTAISAGQSHTLALKSDGTVWSWGNNLLGQLGDGTAVNRSQPVQVPLPAKIVKISAGTNHNAALASDGVLWVWGDNNQGQLGGTAGSFSASPVPLRFAAQIIEIAAGVNQTAVETTDGVVLTWGGNEYGQLGDGTFAQRTSPVLVVNPTVDGFLNLFTGTTVNVSPEFRVPFFVAASGSIADASATVSTLTRFNAADIGKSGGVYVTAWAPANGLTTFGISTATLSHAMSVTVTNDNPYSGGKVKSRREALGAVLTSADPNTFVVVQLTPSGWQLVENGQLIPYTSGVLGDQLASQTILNATDTTNLKGAEFCLGYGTSAEEMTSTGRMRAVATIPSDTSLAAATAGSCIIQAGDTGMAGQVVEFYNAGLDHYFITANPNEAAAIDSGVAGPGWNRTGNTFKSGGTTSVCRFYGSYSPGPNSHFYTVAPGECQGLKNQQLPADDPRKLTDKSWNFESLDFVSTPPVAGTCPAGTASVYRAYNNGHARGVDSNHRITPSQAAIQEAVARGWSNEGVVMCAPE